MSFNRELPGPRDADQAAAPLRGLLDLAQLVRDKPGQAEVLTAVAGSVSRALGFDTVAINLFRPETDDYEVSIVHGNERAREALLGEITSAHSWSTMLQPRFLRHGAFFVPADATEWETSATYTPEAESRGAGDDESAWRPGDGLFVSLDGTAGRHYGIMSVDEPQSGRRPDDHELAVLTAVAGHAALAIQSARQLRQLQTALARNRAVIDSSPDSVIAIDRQGRVLEFNPAAERTFGFSSAEVQGRDLATLIVPPELRQAHRRGLARALRNEWQLLGRRIETTAMRADGSRLPVELALTVVPDQPEGGPFVYGFIRDISERRRGEEHLVHLAYHDALTGLPNRILVEQELDLALARGRRGRAAVALMFVDLDDFKEVNDRLGHAAGDRLLSAVAIRLRQALRDSDLLARQGGDEFIVLLADIAEDPRAAAELVATKLLEVLRESFTVAGPELRVGASIGISVFPDDAADTETLLRHADMAMYRAKSSGGGQLAFHHATEEIQSRRVSLATQLRRAISRSELELQYEPVWQLDDPPSIIGVEALPSWRHPERGLLAREAFLILAEQSVAGDEVMNWILGDACRQAQQWRGRDLHPRVCLNVSPQRLLAPGFAARFAEHARACAIPSGQLMVELNESAWAVDAADIRTVITGLQALGVKLAIDDFGAGYSSLARLREIGFDVIKVDSGLLADVPGDRSAVAILQAILDLAGAYGADIIAQGIHSAGQLKYLKAHGIRHAQGVLLGPPARGEELTALLLEHRATTDQSPC